MRAIYRTVLTTIAKHELPDRIAVWDRTIDAATMLAPRVPRHAPENQFINTMPGLPPSMQRQLLNTGSTSLPVLETAFPRLDQPQKGLDMVGLSAIVHDQHNALLYAEVCGTEADAVCGGEGYWLVQSGAGWRVKKHVYLWQGVSTPFWLVNQH